MFLDKLHDVEKKYYPMNYWGWLENISPDGVEWQIDEMDSHGLGGYVLHARGGLAVPYMGRQWMDSIKATIDRGKQHGICTIIDDENGWPSGSGDGEVNGMGEEYWFKWLDIRTVDAAQYQQEPGELGRYVLEDGTIKPATDPASLPENTRIVVVFYGASPYYADVANAKAVEKFIEVSYQRYYDAFKQEFDGGDVYAFFSDEPQLGRSTVGWSSALPEVFRKEKGYDILGVLPALYYKTDGWQKIRYDYWDVMNRMFINGYARQIFEWCGGHNVRFTGHSMDEESLKAQIGGSAGAMGFYEYEHIPGIDDLCRCDVDNLTVRQATSVGEQLGKERVLCEMYGCTGWNVSFEDLKRIGEWHLIAGVNLMLQHLGLYSLKGSRKREYPPSLFYQQPWWNELPVFNRYFARLGKLVAESRPKPSVLLIHPLKSGWIAYNHTDLAEVRALDEKLKLVIDTLAELGYQFHLGDESMMARHAAVNGNRFCVGQCEYECVVIPPCFTLDASTCGLLRKFRAAGGKVLTIGDPPTLLDGAPDADAAAFAAALANTPCSRDGIESGLGALVKREATVHMDGGQNCTDIYTGIREADGETLYYFFNKSISETLRFTLEFADKTGGWAQLDLETPGEAPVDPGSVFTLVPAQSLFLVRRAVASGGEAASPANKKAGSVAAVLPKEWTVRACGKNAVTLDACEYRVDGGDWQGPEPIIQIQQKMLALGKPVDLLLRFEIEIARMPEGELLLATEEPERMEITINGGALDTAPEGWFVDKSIRTLPCGRLLAEGKNTILISRRFACSEKTYRIKNDISMHEAESNRVMVETELESIYLLGDFSVKTNEAFLPTERRALWYGGSFVIDRMEPTLPINDLTTSGYPFFSGRMTLSAAVKIPAAKDGGRILLRFGRPDAIVVNVSVNGRFVKTLAWGPYEADITDALRDGENQIELELVGSNRNLLGPHHNNEGECYAVGPETFTANIWENYELRITKPVWDERFCFVKFGIDGDIEIVGREG